MYFLQVLASKSYLLLFFCEHVCFIALNVFVFFPQYFFSSETSYMFSVIQCDNCCIFLLPPIHPFYPIQRMQNKAVAIFFLCSLIWCLITVDWTTCQEEFSSLNYSCLKNIQWLHQRCFITTVTLTRLSVVFWFYKLLVNNKQFC